MFHIYTSCIGSPAEKKQEIISRLFELESMGKVATGSSQGPQKSCKGDEKQVNSLLKVIPPKVYITDSSSFKRLVQELTGNGKHAMSSPSPPPMQELHDHVPVISIEEYGEPEVCSFVGEDSYGGMQLSDDSQILGVQALSPLTAFTAFQTAWMTQQTDEFQYQEHGAWSMDIDPFPFYDGYSFQTEEEIFSSQYDLSELYDLL